MKRFTKILLSAFLVLSIHMVVKAQQGGFALKFDGTNDYVDAGTPVVTQIANNLSITVWIKPSASTGWRDILTNQWKYLQSGLILAINGATGQLHYAATGTNINYIGRDPVSNTLDGKWHHVALTLENGVFKTYLDGTLIDTYNSGLTEIKYTGGYKFLIGRDSGDGGEYFNGCIDEVSIWNTVRTEAQIKASMYKELAGNETGLVSYYKMAEGSGTSIDDGSPNSNNGALTNGTSWIVSGCFAGSGKALNFDGTNDYVLMPAGFMNAFDGLSHFSFCGWVYPTNLSGTTWGTFFTNYASFGNWNRATFHQLPNSYGGGADDILISISNVGAYGEAWTTSNVLELNKWVHLAVVYDGTAADNAGKIKIYVNGKPETLSFPSGTNFPATIAADANTSYIGRYHNPDYFKGGNFDEFSFWNTTLTEAQVRENMTKTLAGNETGLFAYYRFDQSDGTTLYDISGNGYNGTLINMDAASDWVSSTAFNTWLGSESNAWGTSANWSNGVPASAQSIGLYKWALGSEATLSGSPTVNNLMISEDASPIISSNFTASGSLLPRKSISLAGGNTLTTAGSLFIENGKTLTIPSGGQLTVTGALNNNAGNGGLVVNPGGSLIQNTSNVAATVKRAITGDDKYHFFISPITESVVADAASCFNGAYLDRYQESTGEWVRLTTGDNVVSAYGYSVNFANGSPELIFPGTLKNSPVSYSNLSYTPSAPGYGTGWNLMGNPYPCGINTALLAVPIGMNATAYVWDEAGSGNYIPLTIGAASANPGTIAPMQGFFVNTTAASNALTLANAAKVHGVTFYKNSNTATQLLTLSIAGNGYSDKTYVCFDEAASENFDQALDAYKLSGLDAAPQLYSILQGEKAAINTLPSYTENPYVPLGLKAGATTTYILTVDGIDVFDPELPIYLDDLKLGTSHNLRTNPRYSFAAAPGDAENRFRLRFVSATGIDEEGTSDIAIWSAEGYIHITHASPAKGMVYVYSTSGQLIATSEINTGETLIRTSAAGIYLVKVVTDKTTVNGKVVVN